MPNKATKEAKVLAQALTFENPVYVKNLRRRLESGECAPAVEVAVLAYGYGKPVETVEHAQTRPFVVQHRVYPIGVDPLARSGPEMTVARPQALPPGP